MKRAALVLVLTLLVGIAVGVAGTLLLPGVATPYLPSALRPATHLVQGVVARKQREPDRLLLRVETDRGSLLVTFTRKIPEVDVLVEPGDRVTLAVDTDRTFVDDPAIERVTRPTPPAPDATRSPAR